jgi:lantibiotic modifying enzyme
MKACKSTGLVIFLSILIGQIGSLGVTGASVNANGKFTEAEKAAFKSYFDQIAHRLVKEATKKERGISWINISSEGKPEESLDFYTGDSGICYFLLKAYAATRQKEYLEAAGQGMDYILSQSKTDAKGRYFHEDHNGEGRNGVFEGNAGPGYLFLYAYHVTRDKKYLKLAEEVADRMVALPDVGERSSPDIISGAAGAGLFLLKIHEVTKKPAYLAGAEKLGDFIIAKAEPQAKGAKWKVTGGETTYYFVGFSHGPAGIGYYLGRLYRATRKEKYREYADKAMDHIAQIAIPEKGYVKWYHEELARQTRYSSQWCHGAPGMNPFFLELYTENRDPKYLDWAAKNTRYLLDQGVDVRKNASVCHGIAGNTASLYQLYQTTKDDSYFGEIRRAAKLLDETAKKDDKGFYWEPIGRKVDYSYMTGLAGVGDFYVLLYSDGKLGMMGALGYGDDF